MTEPLTHPSIKGYSYNHLRGLSVDGWFKETSPMWPGQGIYIF